MVVHRRKFSKEFKMEMVEALLSGKSSLVLGKENDINPNMISRWKRQYLSGAFHGTSKTDNELRKLKVKLCELEQMVGIIIFVFITIIEPKNIVPKFMHNPEMTTSRI